MAGSFPWHLVILYATLDAAISYPARMTYARKWVLAPCMAALALHIYTQPLTPSTPYIAASVGAWLSVRLFSAINIIYAHPDYPDFWRRTKDGDQPPSTFGVSKKLDWMGDTMNGTRRVGWVQEPTSALPPRPNPSSRLVFVVSRIAHVIFHLFVLHLMVAYQDGNPAFDPRVHPATDGPGAYIQSRPAVWRTLDVASHMISVLSGFNVFHGVICVSSVIMGSTEPSEWPYMFGSFAESYTVRKYWG